jgi:hypothetical protein
MQVVTVGVVGVDLLNDWLRRGYRVESVKVSTTHILWELEPKVDSIPYAEEILSE